MICLCCGKPIKKEEAASCGWHLSCIKHFFGTTRLPEITISNEALEWIANETISKGYTVPGVQKKLSLHLSKEEKARLTLVGYPSGYILKPQTNEYRALPEAEQMIMCMADAAGITTVPHGLIQSDGTYAYITKRVDRMVLPEQSIRLLAMEDFCQLTNRLTNDKYQSSYERCAKVIDRWSSQKGLDMAEFFISIVFSYLVGNSDMHLKNFSLKETEPGSRNFQLSKAYDLLPVNVIMPDDKEQLALTINGKKRNIHKKEFRILAESCGIPLNSAERMMKKVCSLKAKLFTQIEESCLSAEQKEQMEELISKRLDILS